MVNGKNINFRTVDVSDAEFILDLRMDDDLNKHISSVENDVNKQRSWIENYKLLEQEEKQYYFIIEGKNQEKFGTVRIYDFRGKSFCWGSWIVKQGSPAYVSIESALLVYEFAFYELKFEQSHFDVRKENSKVVEFHKRLGAKIVNSDELNYYFEYMKSDFHQIKVKYSRFIKVCDDNFHAND